MKLGPPTRESSIVALTIDHAQCAFAGKRFGWRTKAGKFPRRSIDDRAGMEAQTCPTRSSAADSIQFAQAGLQYTSRLSPSKTKTGTETAARSRANSPAILRTDGIATHFAAVLADALKNSHSVSVASSFAVIGPTMLSGKVRSPPGQ